MLWRIGMEQATLAKAFRPQDSNNEPATVLLERVRADRETNAAQPGRRRRGRGS